MQLRYYIPCRRIFRNIVCQVVFLAMDEPILLPVTYRGVLYEFPLELVILGYIYQLHVEVEGQTLIFERDENRDFRMIQNTTGAKSMEKGLAMAIIDSLNSL